jgi:hypothetical protein
MTRLTRAFEIVIGLLFYALIALPFVGILLWLE